MALKIAVKIKLIETKIKVTTREIQIEISVAIKKKQHLAHPLAIEEQQPNKWANQSDH
jgi:hypothetical protein